MYKVVIFGLLTTICCFAINTESKKCEPHWSYFNGHCYRRTMFNRRGTDAREECIKNYGADLVRIDSAEEQKFLSSLLHPYSGLWIGLKRWRDRKFYWLNGHELPTYTNWAPGEPNGYWPCIRRYENCVEMNTEKERYWNDLSCKKLLPSICEKKAE